MQKGKDPKMPYSLQVAWDGKKDNKLPAYHRDKATVLFKIHNAFFVYLGYEAYHVLAK